MLAKSTWIVGLLALLLITHGLRASGAEADAGASAPIASSHPDEDLDRACDTPEPGTGLVVHLGASDENLTLVKEWLPRATQVHALTSSADAAARIRSVLIERKLHGPVIASHVLPPRLPYAENLVNAIFVSDWCSISPAECFRVLAPLGHVLLSSQTGSATLAEMRRAGFESGLSQEAWLVYMKPWPTSMDQWTHFLHDASGNAVAEDTQIGVPQHLRWSAGPRYGRHHNRLPTVSAMVSSSGRLFYILDDAPAGARKMPGRYQLIARDAFNGTLLWRRPVAPWGWEAWSDKPLPGYSPHGPRGGRFMQPLQLGRTLVADDKCLYVTLGFGDAVSRLDMQTGRILLTYAGTENTDEILCHEDWLVLATHDQAIAQKMKNAKNGERVELGKRIQAFDLASGARVWTSDSFVGVAGKRGFMDIHRHLNPAIGKERVFLTAKASIICLDLKTGKLLWQAPRVAAPNPKPTYDNRFADMVTLVSHDDYLLFAQLEPDRRIDWRQTRTMLYAYSADTGKLLWQRPCASWAHHAPPDVWAIDQLVWVADVNGDRFVGLDPANGTVQREIGSEKAFDQEHHHRCYRNKATSRYLLTSFHGMELFDVTGEAEASVHPWVRSVCRYGFLPANGMIYKAPDHCACYRRVKLDGFCALATAKDTQAASESQEESNRITKGPAYGMPQPASQPLDSSSDWPAFRHDSRRSGISSCGLPAKLAPLWKTSLRATPTQATIADGRVYVAVPDLCLITCIDAVTGRQLWTFPVESRVDTPPTWHRSTVVFGCADGSVRCLRATDGQLIWRFEAAPRRRLVASDGMLESAWPVHGSIVVEDGKAYVVAGRSPYLDGGFVAWILNSATGQVLSHQTLAGKANFLGIRLGQQGVPGVNTDVLVSDGELLFMRDDVVFPTPAAEGTGRPRLSTLAGFLDDSLFNRTSQWRFAAQGLGDYAVANAEESYGWRLSAGRPHPDFGYFQPGTDSCELYAYRPASERTVEAARRGKRRQAPPIWRRKFPVVVRAMVKAGSTLCAAGTPDEVSQNDPWRYYERRGPGVLVFVDAGTGKTTAEHTLESPPVYHGLAAANGRLFVSCKNGDILCFAAPRNTPRP